MLLLHNGRIRVDVSVDELRRRGHTLEELTVEVSLGKRDGTFL